METALPLVSFCLMCYNQEKYIASALYSALNQSYSPLEIVVSDDCSSDNSWNIIQNIVNNYSGDKTIILNRNEKNLGMGLNWCKLCSLATGILLFKGDGDDISDTKRVSIVVDDWIKNGRRALLISHSYSHIDLQGKNIGACILPIKGEDKRSPENIYMGRGFFHPGTGSAYHRRLYEEFGDFSVQNAPDDAVFVGRAVLLGGGRMPNLIRVVPDILVQYRIGSGATTFTKQYRQGMIRGLNLGVNAQVQMLNDLRHVSAHLSKEDFHKFENLFNSRLNHLTNVLKLYQGRSFSERFVGYKEARGKNIISTYNIINVLLLLPKSIGDFLLNTLLFIKYLINKIVK